MTKIRLQILVKWQGKWLKQKLELGIALKSRHYKSSFCSDGNDNCEDFSGYYFRKRILRIEEQSGA